jgi:hypothetical protein
MFFDPSGQGFLSWFKRNVVKPIGNAVKFIADNALVIAQTAIGITLCFVPGLQMLGVSLIVAGGLSLMSSGLAAAGVGGGIISAINIGVGAVLCFVPGMQLLGVSIIGAELGAIAGGHISEALGFGYGTGAMIGGTLGSIAGGRVYNYVRFSKIAKQGAVIGKSGQYDKFAKLNGYVYYSGMKGYKTIEKISPAAARKLGWANNYHYIKSVMRHGGKIYDLGGPLTGSYVLCRITTAPSIS